MPPALPNHLRYAPTEPGRPQPSPVENAVWETRALQATLAAVLDPAAKQVLILLLQKTGLLEETP